MKKIIQLNLLFLFFINTPFIQSQTWSKLGDGLDYSVNAIAYFNGSIYAGSDLVYMWNGNSWTAITDGMNGALGVTEIDAMAVNNNTLFAGGTFFVTTPDLDWYNYAARLDNGSWTTCGSGLGNDGWCMNDIPLALISYGGSLYAGGKFTDAGGSPLDPQTAMYIARFDGAIWNPVGGGLDEHITDMTIYNNQLIVSGYFQNAGGVQANYIAAWDGGSWHALGSGMSNGYQICKVTALTIHNGYLYAGGLFDTAGNKFTKNIAKWDGVSWSPVGDGINSQVYSLISYNGNLYAGGNFSIAGGGPGNYIAKWNGVQWFDVDGGTDGPVNFFLVQDNKLYVGGSFSSAGNQPAKNIAVWSDGITDVNQNRVSIINEFNLYQNYPNPFNPSTSIKYTVPFTQSVTLKIYDIIGNEIATLVNGEKSAGDHEIKFDASHLSSGVYFYKLQAENYVSTKKMILIR